jgi:hypothetical protein
MKLAVEYLLFTRHSLTRWVQPSRFAFNSLSHHKPELQTMSVVIWINITALQVSDVWQGFEGHETSERDGPFLLISQPPISLCKMSLLQHRPFRNKFIEGFDRFGERDPINFLELIGHQGNVLGLALEKRMRHRATSCNKSSKSWRTAARLGKPAAPLSKAF